MTQAIVPLFGTGNIGRSKFVSDETRINLYLEAPKDPDKSGLVMYQRPGLKPYPFNRTVILPAGPMRGGIFVTYNNATPPGVSQQQSLIFAERDQIWNLVNSGDATPYGDGGGTNPMITTSGRVSFADNGNQVIAIDGTAGYVYPYNPNATPPLNGAGRIVDPDFPVGATYTTFLAGRFIVNDAVNPGRFYWSDLYDGSSWDGLNFATAETNPDPLTLPFESGGQLLLIGTQTIEWWAPSGGEAAFARVGGAAIDWGSTAPASVQKFQGGVVMLARNRGGARQVIAISGYSAQVISTPDVEFAINNDPAPDSAIGVSTTSNGHAFYVLSLSNTSWVYDAQNGTWSEWQTEGQRWAGNVVTQSFAGGQFASDYRNDSLYTIEPEYGLDGAALMTREVTSRHFFKDYERLSVDKLTVDVQVGKGSVIPLYYPFWADFTQASARGDTSEGGAALPGTSFTCEFKAKFLTASSGSLIKWARSLSDPTTVWQVIFSGGDVLFQVPDASAEVSAPLTTYAEQSFAVTFDGSTLVQSIYVNGALVAAANNGASMSGSSQGLFSIGDTNQNFYMRDFRLWSYVRSAEQIAANVDTQFGSDTPGLVALCNNLSNSAVLDPTLHAYFFDNLGSNGGNFAFSSGTFFVPDTAQFYEGTPRAPQLMLQVSKDNGNTWGSEIWQELGQIGQYAHRTCWNRLGRGRDFLFKFRMTDNVPLVITGGAVRVTV